MRGIVIEGRGAIRGVGGRRGGLGGLGGLKNGHWEAWGRPSPRWPAWERDDCPLLPALVGGGEDSMSCHL